MQTVFNVKRSQGKEGLEDSILNERNLPKFISRYFSIMLQAPPSTVYCTTLVTVPRLTFLASDVRPTYSFIPYIK